MRAIIIFVGLFIAGSIATAESAPGRLVVHEWGTFTNFAGSDGAYLEYRPLIGADLPGFVFDREKQAGLTHKISGALFTKATIKTRSRMETPVTYFYTDVPMSLEVRVDFPHGLLTEFYPPVRAMGPESFPGAANPIIGNAFLDWGQITVFPQNQLEASRQNISPVSANDPYAAARQTDSDIVWITNILGNAMEKFLFYRGVGNFDLPVKMVSLGQDRFEISNTGSEPIHAAFLVQVNGGKVRFTHVGQVDQKSTATLPPRVQTVDMLSQSMTQDLIAEGLYEKEATAMVNTWKSSWFGEEGTRLLYLLPQSFTDRELPLKIFPAPQKTLRVMVGRLEILTPELEDHVAHLLLRLNAADCAEREAAIDQLHLMGRFAEPALQRIQQTVNTPETTVLADSVLTMLRSDK